MQKTDKPKRSFLFHPTCREGMIFEGDDIDLKLEDGWVDDPTKLADTGNPDADLLVSQGSELLEEAKNNAEQILNRASEEATEIIKAAHDQAADIIASAKEDGGGATLPDNSSDDALSDPSEDVEYPILVEGVWYDKEGAFDPAKHVMAQGADKPKCTKDGTFRKLPKAN